MTAAEILQAYLDEVGEAVMKERFDDYLARLCLPFRIQTRAATLIITTVADLQDGFDDYVEMNQSRNVTRMLRQVKEARFEADDRIVGIYDTRLLSGNQPAVPTFYSKMWLGRFDGVWKATEIRNTTDESRWPILLSRVPLAQSLPEEF